MDYIVDFINEVKKIYELDQKKDGYSLINKE